MGDKNKPNVAALLERGRKETALHERMNTLMGKVREEDRVFTAEEMTSWAEMQREAEQFKEQRESFQEYVGIRDEFRSAQMPGNPGTERKAPETPDEVRKMVGSVALAQFQRSRGKEVPEELRDITMETGASGGVLFTPQHMNAIMSVLPQTAIIRPRAFAIPSGGQGSDEFEVPYFDQSTSAKGGVTFTHRKETGTMNESNGEFGMLKLSPEEQSTYIQIGKKTAQKGDAVGLGTFITSFFGREKQAVEDYLFINGTGENEPLGIKNAGCKESISRNTSSEIKFADVSKMYVAQMDNAGAVWIANKKAMQDIIEMADSNGNNLIFKAGDVTKGVPATLLGYPILETTNAPGLGSEGDLMFVNLNYYLIKDGRSFEMSIYDVRPENQLLDYVALWDVDGAPWLKNAVQFKDGNTYSPFVVLAE